MLRFDRLPPVHRGRCGAGAASLAVALWAGVSTSALAAAAAAPPPTVEALEVRADPLSAVAGDIKPEVQLSPEDIQGYGVGTVTELLGEISAQTTSADEGPVILLNGRQISGMQEISDIPAEAIQRVDVLPEEASVRFGYSGSQRVVNIVLRPVYRGVTAELGAGGPTEGGRFSGSANGNTFVIDGEKRVNFGLRYSASSALTEDERDLVSRVTTPYSIAGNVVGSGSGEIDPALSALVGRPVTVAGVPAVAATRPPTLADFSGTAGAINPDDGGAFRTLSPKSQQLTANLVVAKPLSQGISATVNGTLGLNQSNSLRGLPSLGLLVGPGHPFSPFSQPIVVDRYVTGLGPLEQDTDSWSGRLAANVRGDFGDWRTNLSLSYDHNDSLTHTDVGVDASSLQTLLNARSSAFNPFGPLPSTLSMQPEQKSRSLRDTLNARLLVRKNLFKLPAGQVSSSFRLSDAQNWSASTAQRQGVTRQVDLSRNTLGGQATLNVPLTSRRNTFLPGFGELSANGNLAVDEVSDFGTLTTVGFGANWTPVTSLQFRASFSSEERPPSLQQLGDPLVQTPNSRVFDYVRGETVDVTSIAGGNPNLVAERRESLRLSFNAKPFSKLNLTLSANYTANRNLNPAQSFPAITAEIQAAFPDRFTRGPDGRLLLVDLRPVNFQREEVSQLRWGLNFTHRFARPTPPGAPQRGAPGAVPRGPGPGAAAQGAAGQGVRPQVGAPGGGGQRPGGPGQFGQGQRVPGQGVPGQGLPGGGQARGQAPGGGAARPGGFGAQAGGGPVVAFGGPDGGFERAGPDGPGGGGGPPLGDGPPGGGDFAGGGFDGGGPGGGFPGGGAGFGGGGLVVGPGGGGFGGGPGGGGGGGPGGGRGGGGAGGGKQAQFAVYHTVIFEDRIFIRPGVPALDLLNGSAAGSRGGRSRHQVELQAGYNDGPLGLRINTTWQSSTFVTGSGGSTGTLRFSSLTTTNLRVFANLGQVRWLIQQHPILENTRLTLSVNNLFNQRQGVRDATGATPLSYQPGYLDPIGRNLRLEVRKQF